MSKPFASSLAAKALLLFIAEVVLLQPLLVPLSFALAASPSPTTQTSTQNPYGDPVCQSEIQSDQATADPALDSIDTSDPTNLPDAGEGTTSLDINFSAINRDTKDQGFGRTFDTAYILDLIQTQGPDGMWYQKDSNGDEHLIVCGDAQNSIDPDLYNPLIPFTPDALETVTLLIDPSPKLVFANPLDYYAVVGTTCSGGFIDTPEDQWTKNPCKQFSPEDDVFHTGQWTAPKVTAQVLRTLAYLIDPKGANREYIEVKSITQSTQNDQIAQYIQNDPSASKLGLVTSNSTGGQSGTGTSPPAAVKSSAATPTTTVAATDTPTPTTVSAQYTDPNDIPWKPVHLSKGLIISKIDKVRIGTQVTQVRFFGNNSVNFQFQNAFPIDVSWQTSQGLASNPPPDLSSLSMLGNSRSLMNAAVVQMLTDAGIGGDFNIDTSKVEVNNFTDAATLVGKSLLNQALGTPQFSLEGYDLTSVLESIGRRYLEQQLGLVTGSLSDGSDFDSIIQNIGRVSIEYSLGLPTGSLKTENSTSAEILDSIGKRYLESEIFRVSTDTLDPVSTDPCSSDQEITYPTNTVGDLLTRLGEGRIEQAFGLPSQSMRRTEYDSRPGENVCNSMRQSSFKSSLIFPKPNNTPSSADYSMGDYVAGKLSLAFTAYGNSATDMYGFTAADYSNTLVQLETGKMSLATFKQVVGARVIEGSTGAFYQSGVSTPVTTQTNSIRVGSNSTATSALNNVPVQDANGRGGVCTTIDQGSDNRKAMQLGVSVDNYNSACQESTVASGTADLDILGTVKTMLLTPSTVTKSVFHPDDTIQAAPVYGQPIHMYGLNNDNSSDTDKRYYEVVYNNAEKNYYNDPRLLSNEPVNTLSSIVATTTASTSEETLSNALNDVAASDPGIKKDLNTIYQLYNAQTTSGTNFLDLTPISKETGSQLNADLTARMNAITVRPAENNFLTQYNDSSTTGNKVGYQGWQFLLQDLQARVQCAQSSGQYQYNNSNDNPAFVCRNTATSTNSISADQQAKYTSISQELDTLLSQLDTYTSAILSTIERGSAPDSQATSSSTTAASISTKASVPAPVTNTVVLDGQSMMSVAVGIPGQIFNTDANNQYNPNSIYYSQDPMRALLTPGRDQNGVVKLETNITNYDSLISEIGRVYAAKKFTDNPFTQKKLITQMQTSLPSFFSAVKNLSGVGFSDTALQQKGLLAGDFSRIFQLDLATQVFYRRGEEELLRVAWQKTDAATQISTSAQYNSLIQGLNQVNQTLNFYKTRIDIINKDTKTLNSNVGELTKFLQTDSKILGSTLSDLGSQLGQASGQTVNGNTIDEYKNISQNYEPVLGKYFNLINAAIKDDPTNQKYNQYKSVIDASQTALEDSLHAIQEIVAGKELPRSRQGNNNINNGFGSTQVGKNACFSGAQVIYVFTKGKKTPASNVPQNTDSPSTQPTFQDTLTDFGLNVGGCELDQSLGLPNNTLYNWYHAGKQDFPDKNGALWDSANNKPQDGVPQWTANSWSVEGLELSAGLADAQAKGNTNITATDLSKLSAPQAASYVKIGGQILAVGAVAKLASLIPGVGKALTQYKITASDLASTLNGDFRPVVAKVGGANIDHLLGLPAGTGYQLVLPTCHDNNGNVTPCDSRDNVPGSDPDNIRQQVFAQAAFNKLGLTIPNFPATFDMTAGGNMLANWGEAQISQDLGLTANSFNGKISDHSSDLWTQNSMSSLMSAFGLTPSPYFNQAQTLFDNIMKEVHSLNGLPADFNFSGLQDLLTNYQEKITFGRLLSDDPTKSYWQTDAAAASSNANSLASQDATSIYGQTDSLLASLWKEFGTNSSIIPEGERSSDLLTALRQAMLTGVEESTPFGISGHAVLDGDTPTADFPMVFTDAIATDAAKQHDTYTSILTYFNTKVASLDTHYSLQKGTFKQFLQNQIDASAIAQSNGVRSTLQSILGNKVDQWINSSAPQWLKDVNTGFKELTAGICTGNNSRGQNLKDGMGLGLFLSEMIDSDPYQTCSISGLSLINGKDVLYGNNPNQIQFRDFLYNKLLSKVFSTGLEKDLGIQAGTFERMAIDPRHAPEIIISQGILKLTNQVFGGINVNDPCDNLSNPDPKCLVTQLKLDLRGAFLAGFYNPSDPYNKANPTHPIYSLEFNTKRSIAALTTLVGNEVDLQLGRIGQQYLGTQITRADLGLFLNGDGRFFSFLALQFAANSANKILLGDTRKDAQASKHLFAINYNDVRLAAGLTQPTKQLQDNAGAQGQADYERTMVCGIQNISNASCDKLSSSDVDNAYKGYIADGTLDYNTELNNQAYQYDIAVANYNEKARINAQHTMQYKLFDIAAFEIDANIPPDFTRRLFAGTKIEQATALTQYGYNILAANNKEFANFLKSSGITSADLATFTTDLLDVAIHGKDSQNGVKDLQFLLTSSVAQRIDTAFTNWLVKDLDIRDTNFPTGLLKGTIAWGMAGFKSSQFNTDISFGSGATKFSVPSIGLQLENYGYSVVESWGDHMLKLKPGTTKDIIQFTQVTLDIGKVSQQIAAGALALKTIGKSFDLESSITFNDPAYFIDPSSEESVKAYIQAYRIDSTNGEINLSKQKLSSLKLMAAQIAENIVFNDILGSELSKVDASIGLPPGTMAQMLSIGTTGLLMYFKVLDYNPATIEFAVGMLLYSLIVGVVKVDVVSTGSANGYYPFYTYGTGPAAQAKTYPPDSEHHSNDPWIPDFDAKSVGQYHAGLRAAAQAKVTGLLKDLLAMPTSNWAKANNFKPLDLWIYQGFTYGDTTYNPLTDSSVAYYLNQPLPGSVVPNLLGDNYALGNIPTDSQDVGYNEIGHCQQVAYDDQNRAICKQNPSIYSGFYPSSFFNGIYLAW